MRENHAFDLLLSVWTFCEVEDREAFFAYLRVSGAINEPAAATDTAGDYLREPAAVVSGQIIREGDAPRETGRFGGVASSPDTELKSDGDAISEVKGKARPENAAGVEPSPSDRNPHEPPSSQATADRALPTSSPEAPTVSKPDCLRPDGCKLHFTSALCASCDDARLKARTAGMSDHGSVFPPRDEWDIAAYPTDDVVAGYREHRVSDPLPGPNRAPGYRWGAANRQRDMTHEPDGFDHLRHAFIRMSRNAA